MNNKNLSILNNINNIDLTETIAEEAVYNAMQSEYNKLYEMSIISATYYQESIGSAIKKGVGFIIGLIKKVIGMILYGIKSLISFIKNIFKGKNKRNVNNILDDMDVKAVTEFFTESSSNKTEEKLFYIDINGNVLKCRPTYFARKKIAEMNKKTSFVSNELGASQLRSDHGSAVILFIKYPETFKSLKDILMSITIKDGKITASKDISEKYSNYVEAVMSKSSELLNDFEKDVETLVNVNNLKALNSELIKMNAYVDKLMKTQDDSGRIDKYLKPNTSESDPSEATMSAVDDNNTRLMLDIINNVLVSVNMGINSLIHDIKDLYVIDKKYHKSIDDPDRLDEFISNMLGASYPSNIILHNIKIIIKNTMGDDIKTGQTRAVILNEKDGYVLKCALNSSGISANVVENDTFKTFKKHGKEDYLAAILELYPKHTITKQEFCKDIGNVNAADKDELYNEIDKFCKEENIDILGDRKLDAVGKRVSDDKPIVVDYGIKSRWASVMTT